MIQSFVEGVPGLASSYLVGLGRQASWFGNSGNENSDAGRPTNNSAQTLREDLLLLRLLDEVLTICEHNGWPLLAVLVDNPDERLEKLEAFLSARGVVTVVIPPKRDRPDLYYITDGHWNAAGHRFAADRILEVIGGFYIRE